MKQILLFILLFSLTHTLYAQDTSKNDRVLYIIDKIPLINDPDEHSGTVTPGDVETLTVITDKDQITKMGYPTVTKVLEIITKEYQKRPDEIKKIPSTKLMDRKDNMWYLKDADKPYTGPFIDYFLNGKKQGEGNLKDGIVDGLRTVYLLNGNKSFFRNYTGGIANGYSEEYFSNGRLKQKGSFKDGLDDGAWIEYYSTGKIKRQVMFKDEKPQFTSDEKKFVEILDKAKSLMQEGDYKSAIKKLDEAQKLNSEYSDCYFYRGTAKLDNLDFDGAINDFDKAIELEPLYMESISNRAFARIRKYQFKNSRTLSQNSEVTILSSKDNVDIPKEEKEKICADLNKGYELGDKKDMIIDAIKQFCK